MKIEAWEIEELKKIDVPFCKLNSRQQEIIEHLRKHGHARYLNSTGTKWCTAIDRYDMCKGLVYRINRSYHQSPEYLFSEVFVGGGGILRFKYKHTNLAISVAASLPGFAGFADEDKELIDVVGGKDGLDASAILARHHDPTHNAEIKYVRIKE